MHEVKSSNLLSFRTYHACKVNGITYNIDFSDSTQAVISIYIAFTLVGNNINKEVPVPLYN